MTAHRVRRKHDGSVELLYDCPACGRKRKYEVNYPSGLYQCWVCPEAGRKSPEEMATLKQDLSNGEFQVEEMVKVKTEATLPDMAQVAIRDRGLDPYWVQKRYLVEWDPEEYRLVWPTGTGYSSRGIWSWQYPKVRSQGVKGLIGQHLLKEEQRLVLVEGDFKAASIPLPWVGLGLCGVSLTDEQSRTIRNARPVEVVVMLDGGFGKSARRVAEKLAPLPVRVVDLPLDKGPDDIERGELLALLGGW